ncbi:acid-sensing ion channel 5-like [Lingula anatina]|uniref:Acid-sensing ion channel 5-like n=1 Tax=Lingula anatina TaxID=7574 RepID=A0A2R2MNG6_LINAN|nr:acid-sensing ion channel 5-like [Lingula anatina]|eukprot:XP_023931755.1 acid-sensing ion channel 5-like [Lingula anatina]
MSFQDFNHVFTAFGNCFTFNANNDAFQDQPGAKNGLSLEINIEQQYYSNRLQLGDQVDAGIFFHVHNQSVPPSVETDGRAVPPGFHAYVGLTRTDSYSIDPPYGLCNKSAELVNFPDYSVAACVLECKEQHMLREKRKGMFADGGYDMRQTTIRANYVIMDIYLENLNYIKSEQLPAVEPSALISDIGGQFGLFMGFSLLTIIEFIEFAAMTLYTWILSAKRQPKVDIVMVESKVKK